MKVNTRNQSDTKSLQWEMFLLVLIQPQSTDSWLTKELLYS